MTSSPADACDDVCSEPAIWPTKKLARRLMTPTLIWRDTDEDKLSRVMDATVVLMTVFLLVALLAIR